MITFQCILDVFFGSSNFWFEKCTEDHLYKNSKIDNCALWLELTSSIFQLSDMEFP